MTPRIEQELTLIRIYFPDVEYLESGGGWIRLSNFKLPYGIWSKDMVDVCFQIPSGYPGQAPYGFYVKDGLRLIRNSQIPTNYAVTSETPFGRTWGKFSWQVDGVWQPTADVHSGGNLISFIRSFTDRLLEAN